MNRLTFLKTIPLLFGAFLTKADQPRVGHIAVDMVGVRAGDWTVKFKGQDFALTEIIVAADDKEGWFMSSGSKGTGFPFQRYDAPKTFTNQSFRLVYTGKDPKYLPYT